MIENKEARGAGWRELRRWDFAEHRYLPWRVPASWRVSVYEEDCEALVECASCGATIAYGESFTSLEIHTDGPAWGYAVCGECHVGEVRRRIAIERDDREGAWL